MRPPTAVAPVRIVLPGEYAGRETHYPEMTGYVTDLAALARMLQRLLAADVQEN